MSEKQLLSFPPLVEGILLKRYKRFLVDVQLNSGDIVTAHCANTGPMKGILEIGGRVRLKHVPSPTRKLPWSWEQAEVNGFNGSLCWVGVNTSLPNQLIRLAIENGFLEQELGVIKELRKEVVYGSNSRSRIDLLLYPDQDHLDQRKIYVEVKNTTWAQGETALFPDTVTERGQKHLKELIGVMPHSRGVLVPCLSRNDVRFFAPGDSADKKYGDLFRKAVSFGLEVLPCCFGFYSEKITWEGKRPWLDSQPA